MTCTDPDITAITVEALGLASETERAAYLDRACAGLPEVRARVEALLAAIGQAGSPLEAPDPAREAGREPGAGEAPSTLAAGSDPGGAPAGPEATATIDLSGERAEGRGRSPCPVAEGAGTRVGPYRLLLKIGEGGMGVVYLAEQEHPVRRRVALKIIRPGMDSEQVVARFEAERQALAMMDHPNIARVFDAGLTDGGRPFFVMELVRGVPITEFCDWNRLTLAQRLELFIPVCQAIRARSPAKGPGPSAAFD